MQKLINRMLFTGFSRLMLLFCALFGGTVFAQCSEYLGRATISEISTNHNWKFNYGDFIELKLLDSSISSSVYNEWALYICSSTCNWAYLSDFTVNGSYLTHDNEFVWGFIDWTGGFSVKLIDKWGYTIDYVSVNNNSALQPFCTVRYDSTASADNSTRRTMRVPDGTGDWDTPSGNSVPATEGESNTPIDTSLATIEITDATAAIGSTMYFLLSLPGNNANVTINYSTFDGTAKANSHYNSNSGSIYVPAGTTMGVIPITTLETNETDAKVFYLIVESAINANVVDHVGIGTIEGAGTAVDHYRYKYDGSGLTCEPETITIQACADPNCSSLSTRAVTATFVAITGNIRSSTTSLAFAGTTTVQIGEATENTIALSMQNANPSVSLKCYENEILDSSCNYENKDTGFKFFNDSTLKDTLPDQIAGKPSNIGLNSSNTVIQAVQKDPETGFCTALFGDNQDVDVQLAYQCINPDSCSSNGLKVINEKGTYTLPTDGSWGTYSLTFGQQAKANLNVNYEDVGKIKLLAQKSVDLGGDLAGSPAKLLSGNTQEFIVRPFGFYLDVGQSHVAINNTSDVFKRAGEIFDAALKSVNWASDDDSDNDGAVDAGADLSNNSVTPNFGQELTPETVTVSHALFSPAAGDAGTLNNTLFNSFSGGISSKSGVNGMSWNNVGIISLSASTDSNYLDQEPGLNHISVANALGNIGRFVPSHFKLLNPLLNQSCNNSYNYMAQNFDLSFNLFAYGVGDIVLTNYDSKGNAVSTVDHHGLGQVSFVAEHNDDGGGDNFIQRFDELDVSNNDALWSDGVYNAVLTPNFKRTTSIDGPYETTFLGIKVDDGDSKATIALVDTNNSGTNMNASTSGACVIGASCDAMQLNPAAAKFYYGRISAQDAFGPATSPITMPLYVEYFNGNRFVTNTSDNCTTIDADEVSLSGSAVTPFAASYVVKSLDNNNQVGTTGVDTSPDNTSTTQLLSSSGEFSLILNAPGFTDGNTKGYVPVIINLTDYPWLQFDWDTNGTGATETHLPTKNVTFGQFRGNDRVISWREKR